MPTDIGMPAVDALAEIDRLSRQMYALVETGEWLALGDKAAARQASIERLSLADLPEQELPAVREYLNVLIADEAFLLSRCLDERNACARELKGVGRSNQALACYHENARG